MRTAVYYFFSLEIYDQHGIDFGYRTKSVGFVLINNGFFRKICVEKMRTLLKIRS